MLNSNTFGILLLCKVGLLPPVQLLSECFLHKKIEKMAILNQLGRNSTRTTVQDSCKIIFHLAKSFNIIVHLAKSSILTRLIFVYQKIFQNNSFLQESHKILQDSLWFSTRVKRKIDVSANFM